MTKDMTGTKSSSTGRPGLILARAMMLGGALAALAACGDYGPQTSGSIETDIASSRWMNQLPPQIPDTRSPGLVQSPM